ncbi:uncharacterized protein LOC128126140 [Lactuca sativa]|uniref:uncharacterized protein LOC128126140 n=1 Tax=Lactuca sativa TaxID=4236 RepID=UPI0022AF6E12|nr:uncharacterized protein LOC128126140 [Lactuca sativa]
MERRLLNASSGGSLPDKTPTEIQNLIKNMAEDSKHSTYDEEWYTDAPRGVKEVQTPQIEAQLSELTKLVMMLAKDKCVQPTPRPCGICTQVGHPTDMCPQLQEEDYEEAKAMGGYSGANQRGYEQPRGDQRWNTNQGWGGNQQGNYQQNQSHQYQPRPPFPQNQPRPPFQPQNFQPRHPQQPPPQASSSSMSLEDIVKSLATSTQSFQQETKASIKRLEQKVSQLAQSVSKMESQGKLPSQTEKNPKHNACASTLRGGKSYERPRMPDDEEEEEKEIEVEEAVKEEEKKSTPKSKKLIESEVKVTPAPFPSRLASTKRETEDDEIMAMFRKVEINIPLLDAITKIPRYAKFLKELCTSKKKLKGNQTVKVGENVSAVLQNRLPKNARTRVFSRFLEKWVTFLYHVPCLILEHQLMFYPIQVIRQWELDLYQKPKLSFNLLIGLWYIRKVYWRTF